MRLERGRVPGVSFGAPGWETGAWIFTRSRWRLLFRGHDSLFIAAWRFRIRIMKPDWMVR